MVKKSRAGGGGPGQVVPDPTGSTIVPSRDVLQRLSYVYQTAALLLANDRRQGLGGTAQVANDRITRSRETEGSTVGIRSAGDTDGVEGSAIDSGVNGGFEMAQRTVKRSEKRPRARDDDIVATRTPNTPVARTLGKLMKDVAQKATVRT